MEKVINEYVDTVVKFKKRMSRDLIVVDILFNHIVTEYQNEVVFYRGRSVYADIINDVINLNKTNLLVDYTNVVILYNSNSLVQ